MIASEETIKEWANCLGQAMDPKRNNGPMMLSILRDIMMSHAADRIGTPPPIDKPETRAMSDHNKPHPHHELMAQYAADAAFIDCPWMLWQVKVSNTSCWIDSNSDISFCTFTKYRRHPLAEWILKFLQGEKIELLKSSKSGNAEWILVAENHAWLDTFLYRVKPKTTRINGIDVPEPISPEEEVEIDTEVFWPFVGHPDPAIMTLSARYNEEHKHLLSSGLLHLDKNSAQAHYRALMNYSIE